MHLSPVNVPLVAFFDKLRCRKRCVCVHVCKLDKEILAEKLTWLLCCETGCCLAVSQCHMFAHDRTLLLLLYANMTSFDWLYGNTVSSPSSPFSFPGCQIRLFVISSSPLVPHWDTQGFKVCKPVPISIIRSEQQPHFFVIKHVQSDLVHLDKTQGLCVLPADVKGKALRVAHRHQRVPWASWWYTRAVTECQYLTMKTFCSIYVYKDILDRKSVV